MRRQSVKTICLQRLTLCTGENFHITYACHDWLHTLASGTTCFSWSLLGIGGDGRDRSQLRDPWRYPPGVSMRRTASALERGVWAREALRRPIERGGGAALEVNEECEVIAWALGLCIVPATNHTALRPSWLFAHDRIRFLRIYCVSHINSALHVCSAHRRRF